MDIEKVQRLLRGRGIDYYTEARLAELVERQDEELTEERFADLIANYVERQTAPVHPKTIE